MNTEEFVYVPSAVPGLTWRIYTHKPQGRDPYVQATEGVKEPGSFSAAYGGTSASRQSRILLTGKRLTAKVKAAAVAEMLDNLRTQGAIA